METENERMITEKMISEDIEMSVEEGDQRMETETVKERMAENDHDQEKNIMNYYESLKGKFFFEALQLQKDNFLELLELTSKKRTKTETIIALALFIVR